MEQERKLPKNIRQIGTKEEHTRIYIEDYVHTFIKKAAQQDGGDMCAGVLLGEETIIDGRRCYFIGAAVMIEELLNAEGEINFSDEAWEKAETELNQFFPQQSICGWFVRGGEETSLDFVKLKQIHAGAFAKESLLYLCRGEEFTFWIGQDTLTCVQGYYIYYETNKDMQAYMVSKNSGKKIENQVQDSAARSFRHLMKEKQEEVVREKKGVMMYRVCAGIALIALVYGISVYMGRSANQSIVPEASDSVAVNATPVAVNTSEPVSESESTKTEEQSVAEETSSEPESTTLQAEETQTVGDVEPVNAKPGFYRVQAGDTLVHISVTFYGTTDMIDMICERNHIEDPNSIFVGQEIELP